MQVIVINNRAVNDRVLISRVAGISGIASLSHARQPGNLFLSGSAGLSFKGIHDGTALSETILHEPRNAPMELRRIGPHTVELHQKPTPHFGLESCIRYEVLTDGVIEMTVECIPRRSTFRNGYIGLVWANDIYGGRSGKIHFQGNREGDNSRPRWFPPKYAYPTGFVDVTYLALNDRRDFRTDTNSPIKVDVNLSPYRYTQPWFYGVFGGMACAQLFRSEDLVRFTNSCSPHSRGSSSGFQFFIPEYQVGKLYRMVMRMLYVPFESEKQLEQVVNPHLKALNPPSR